ncbi:Cysteine-rich RLK (RECEPTOR-like protein kinase) 8 [Theobroma cacao]|uniref:Cysteine-rich RLK (RECEPTOR-like protein kinase) 8 n=1 Tax=Theobroma cacao TaxID=3641 RepID=A0A061E8J1_THECC|nr:Cysteine-rich RLK (RECEPTOR-like protein kinase) 8 [Theobroma cacao]
MAKSYRAGNANERKKNGTWILVDKPADQHIIGVKWIYKIKLNADGTVNKFKAKLVVKGYSQIYGIDYCETFAPVARHDTIRLLSALIAREGWKILYLDVRSAFLNGYLCEDIYIQQLEGFIKPEGFVRSPNEPTVYLYKSAETAVVIISLYIDDLLITGLDDTTVTECKSKLMAEFEMTDLGEMHYFLGMQFIQHSTFICIHQGKYAIELLKRFYMKNSKAVETPLAANCKLSKDDGALEVATSNYKSIIESLLYLTASRPDLMSPASLLSNDWARSLNDSRSTEGYCFSFGTVIFSWNSKKQEMVAQSSAAVAANQAMWIKKILGDLGFEQKIGTPLMIDNKSAISIAKNPVHHGRTKHVKVKFHFIRDAVKDDEIVVIHCGTNDQVADVFTKFLTLRALLGVCKRNTKENSGLSSLYFFQNYIV